MEELVGICSFTLLTDRYLLNLGIALSGGGSWAQKGIVSVSVISAAGIGTQLRWGMDGGDVVVH